MAFSCVALTYVVGRSMGAGSGARFEFSHCTTEVGTKFVPFTVMAVFGLNKGTLVGKIDVSAGTGLITPPVGGGVCQSSAKPSLSKGPEPSLHISPCAGEER